MHIVLDARLFGPRHTGIGIYTQNLIKNLVYLYPEDFFTAILSGEDYNTCHIQSDNFQKISTNVLGYSFKEQVIFPGLLKSLNPDLVHFTNFNKPIFYNNRSVITFHDLTLLKFRSQRKTLKSRLGLNKPASILANLVNLASTEKIIAVSEYTKQELMEFFSVPGGRIKVIYEGFDKDLFQMSYPEPFHNSTLNKFNLKRDDYVLYIGNSKEHKNTRRLVRAFNIFNGSQAGKKKLVMVGGKIDKEVFTGLDTENVVFTGFIEESEKVVLLQNARLFVFPSLAEGFGLPILEAMASKTVIATSKIASLPEVGGDSVIYFNPFSIDDISLKIHRGFFDNTLREQKLKSYQEHLNQFSWQQMATDTHFIYQQCIDR